MNELFHEEIKRCTKIVKGSDKTFGCTKCKYTSNKRYNLKRHIEIMHFVTNGFTCPICNTVYKNRFALQQHVKTHDKEPIYFNVGN